MNRGLKGGVQGGAPPVGTAGRFDRRWHLIGAGLSNVWRFGDLELSAVSGRLLLRGPNGTGKTTVLEALTPYLLDLNGSRMSAGKARTTNLSSLMREGATGKRRFGYAWLTLSEAQEGTWSFGVRIQYSDGASPPVKVIPFAVPGRPLHELKIHGIGRAALSSEQFAEAVSLSGGQIFESDEAYINHLAARLFGSSDMRQVAVLAQRLREVRNPTLLGDVGPVAAAEALRESLPGVSEEVISATAEALAESDATRDAFEKDKLAAEILDDLRLVWSAHATEVIGRIHTAAAEAARDLKTQIGRVKALSNERDISSEKATSAKRQAEDLASAIGTAGSELDALEKHQAYRDAGRLQDLKETASAHQRTADLAVLAMQRAADGASAESDSICNNLRNLAQDLEEYRSQARNADSTIGDTAPFLDWELRPRALLCAGEITADPGPEVVIRGDSTHLRKTASSWFDLALVHEHRADSAELAIIDHKEVEAFQREAEKKADDARTAAGAADRESVKARQAEVVARELTGELLDGVAAWTKDGHRRSDIFEGYLTEFASGTDGFLLATEDIEQFADAEASQVLAICDRWARNALTTAEGFSGELRANSRQKIGAGAALRVKAAELRTEAAGLRAGRLLPLPRPEWAGPGDDSVAFGAVLDWREEFDNPSERALLEAAVAAAGLLGASVDESGASTSCWRVDARGPVVHPNLSEVIAVDMAHPLALAASNVLARVGVVPTASVETDLDSTGVYIGRDGTFSAGVLRGQVPGINDAAAFPPASHIGARQRREAALARAVSLESKAVEVDDQAAKLEELAAQLERKAEAVSTWGQSFPSRDKLREAESKRAAIRNIAFAAQDAARNAEALSESAARELERSRVEWSTRTRERGLPVDMEQLIRLRDQGKATARALRAAAAPLDTKLAERLERVIARYSMQAIRDRLSQTEAAAKEALRMSTDTHTQVRVLEQTAGAAIADVLKRRSTMKEKLSHLRRQVEPARDTQIETVKAEESAKAKLEEGQGKLDTEIRPRAAQTLKDLHAFLSIPGAVDAVLDGEPIASEDALIDFVERKLRGRRTLTVRTVLDRVDAAKAKLAGIWSVDPDESHRELLTFVLTHGDATYTPIEASAHAQKLKLRAEQALAASEERALREFVIGRLPNAIGSAWTGLHDWVVVVNKKMLSAAASSGVGVQVRVPLREDLSPALREVYELSCKVSAAERAPEQQRRLGEALNALITAAQGDAMQERVASAVDIRDWVEVYYEVTRPGGTKQRWTSKTGLSGGERRLVVIAPMLAAIAANYDRFGSRALRLVPLDEVPAEVDEQGREGLARYIGELDLDLICTSYLWDGCPGAWDGIDAHDLEAGPDGTVVAFPMLIRGLPPIPEVGTFEPPNGQTEPLE
jgi:hypothetical protein